MLAKCENYLKRTYDPSEVSVSWTNVVVEYHEARHKWLLVRVDPVWTSNLPATGPSSYATKYGVK
jgi:hypothetical protein